MYLLNRFFNADFKRYYIFFILTFLIYLGCANSILRGKSSPWVATILASSTQDTGEAGVSSIAVNLTGDAYLTGTFQGSITFNSSKREEILVSNGFHDAFLAKINANGTYEWIASWGGLDDDACFEIAVDNDGNAYVVGSFIGEVDFDPSSGTEIRTGNFESFLCKYDSNGRFLWVQTWIDEGSLQCLGIGVTDSGDIFLRGIYSGTVDFDPGSGVEPGITDGAQNSFCCKLDQTGSFEWVNTWKNIFIQSLTVTENNNCLIAGRLSDQLELEIEENSTMLGVAGKNSFFLLQLDQSGKTSWAKSWGETITQIHPGTISDITILQSGDIFLAGAYRSAQDFDPGQSQSILSSNGEEDAFLSRFDSSGEWEWTMVWGGIDSVICKSVGTDSSGNIFAAGTFSGTVDFDPGNGIDEFTACGNSDSYLLKFNQSGDLIRTLTWGGEINHLPEDFVDDGVSDMVIDPHGNPIVSGVFYGNVEFKLGQESEEHESPNGWAGAYVARFPNEDSGL